MKKINNRLLLNAAAVISAAVLLFSCSVPNGPHDRKNATETWQKKRLNRFNDSLFPIINAKIRNGNMVTRLGTDITSEMIRQMNQHDQSFSHCGIASIENDTVFIYHAIGGEFNPDQKLKREPFYSFCHPFENKALGIFEMTLDQSTTIKLIKKVQCTYKQGIPFDMAFDYNTDDRLYCAEFVSKCFSFALKDSTWFQFTLTKGFRYVAVDNLFSNSKMIEKIHLNY